MMEQALRVLNSSKSMFKQLSRDTSKREGKNREGEVPPDATPSELFPLSELLEQLLKQETELWKKNEGLRSTISRAGKGHNEHGSITEPSLRTTGLTPTPTPSLTTTPPHTPTPTPSLTSRTHTQDSTDRDKTFYLVQYGRLTEDIHRYFRRLEKRHACLYLTKRRAKHENLRHVETQVQSEQDEAHGPEVQSAGYLLNGGIGEDGQLVTLRDEELLVFRAALMCAQFPMLSAPSPPEGASPTPPPPTVPFSTIGSPDVGDLSRTAPSDINEDQFIRQSGAVSNGPSIGKISPRLRRSVSDRVKVRMRSRDSPRSVDDDGLKGDKEGEDTGTTDGKGLTSEPINVRGRTKSGLRRVSSTSSSRKLAKRLSMDAASMLPSVDSDDDDELTELNRPRSMRSRDSGHLVGREHPFSPMVNREMLCSLVRRAFKQTEEQQLQFEQMLKHDYGRRSKGEILAKELAGQLQVLENNAHPFYKPKLFVTRNIGYDQWLQSEKQRVRSLIDKFWHFSLPRPQLWRHYNPTDYHRAYSLLLTRIVCCESRTERREPVHAGKTPSSPLSPTAQRLLNEFGLRYGVGELYRKIVYLDYLARHFDYEVWYIRHCTEELRSIRDLLPRNRNKITAVRKEMDLLKTTVHLLHGQTDNCLTKIDRLFQDSPTEGVASLIELLAEVLDAEMSLFGKRILTVEEWLKRYLQRGFALRYERRKEIHADETMNTRTAKPFVPTPALVNALLLSIKDEVKDYHDKFQPVFRPYFDIVPFARMEFYRLMCSDACSLCLRTIHKPETRVRLNLEMLGLLYRLNERDNEWENVIPPDMQQWRHSFVDLGLIWMEVLGKQMNRWVLDSVSKDKWTLLTLSNKKENSEREPGLPIGVRAGISSSPFPSPGYTPIPNTPHSHVGSIGNNGAFMPYHKATRERIQQQRISQEPRSGRCSSRLLSPTDDAVKPVAEIPDLIMRGAHRSTPSSRPTSQENIMQFWQASRQNSSDGNHHNRDIDHGCTVEPAVEIEVSVSVYGSREASPNNNCSPTTGTVHTPPTTEHIHRGGISSNKDDHNTNSQLVQDISSPPLPTPLAENTPETEQVTVEGEMADNNTKDSQVVQHNQGSVTTTDGGGVNDTVGDHENSTVNSTGLREKENMVNEPPTVPGDKHLQDQQSEEVGEKQHSSDYHTPSTISDDEELKQLSDGRKISTKHATHILDDSAGKKLAVSEEGEKFHVITTDKVDDEHTDGVVFQPHHFSSTDPPPVKLAGIDEGGVVKPKPRPSTPAIVTINKPHSNSIFASPEPIISATQEPVFLEDASVVSSTASSFHDTSQNLQKDYSSLSLDRHSDVEGSIMEHRGTSDPQGNTADIVGLQWRVDQLLKRDNSYLFPLSNSPIDIVIMLNRLTCFTSTLLNTLTPKLRHSAVPGLDEPRRAHDYAPDVAMAKRQASQQLKHVENTHAEFLKKLHKIMYSSLKLYADNLLCMDLCCWSNSEAMELLGTEMLHHLQRRRDMKEIWGCRHMVEIRHGLHPNGIPCHKKKSVKFESITRDMCLRINNVHLLITIFPTLEAHLYNTTRKETHRQVTAFGYISSDIADHMSPLHHHGHDHTSQFGAMRSHVARDLRGTLTTSSEHSLLPRGSSLSWGYPSREKGGGAPEKPESGFASRDSDHLIEYLRDVQKVQLKLLCSRMNKFFKPALSLLLELNLGESGIERRLHPLITFLSRHRSALKKYIYPECFHELMNYLWGYILQDLEEEAIKLRESKKPVTSRAQMILQAISHLMEFIHDKDEGVPLQTLTPSCEYLLALLDVMTRSTDQLVIIFNKLSAPQFAMSRLDLTHAPVPVDPTVIHTLRSQLHTFKKCFTGKEFVEQFLKLGREAELLKKVNSSEPTTPSPQIAMQRSPGGKINYNIHYAKEVGQFLLNERSLLLVPNLWQEYDSDEVVVDEEEERVTSNSRLQESSSIQSGQRVRRVGIEARRGGGTGTGGIFGGASGQRFGKNGEEGSPQIVKSRRSTFDYRTELPEDESTTRLVSDIFVYSPQSLYKFADVEDFETRALYHSQILSASAHPHAVSSLEETSAFERARMGMLFLVYDLLLQRAKKEKRVKHFMQTPPALNVADRRKRQFVDCNLIFKM